MLRASTRSVLRATRAASYASQCNRHIALSPVTSATPKRWITQNKLQFATTRELSTSVSKTPQANGSVQASEYIRVSELVNLIEKSREEEDSKRELEHSLELYDILMKRNQQDANLFEVAFAIARVYDEQLEDAVAATRYYDDALSILEALPTKVTAWGAYMRVTTLGALAVCHENLGHSEEAEKYFDDAIGAYAEHCDQAPASAASDDVSDADVSLLADFNATAAMIHYHYAGNLLAQERWEEAKNVTKLTLVLAENSSMPAEDLEELQRCIHELWLEMD